MHLEQHEQARRQANRRRVSFADRLGEGGERKADRERVRSCPSHDKLRNDFQGCGQEMPTVGCWKTRDSSDSLLIAASRGEVSGKKIVGHGERMAELRRRLQAAPSLSCEAVL